MWWYILVGPRAFYRLRETYDDLPAATSHNRCMHACMHVNVGTLVRCNIQQDFALAGMYDMDLLLVGRCKDACRGLVGSASLILRLPVPT